MTSKKYNNPPLVEALCEFQFIPEDPWDYTIPGLFYEKVRNDYPEKRQQAGIGIRLKQVPDGVQHEVLPSPDKMQFFNRDKTELVQVGPDLLVINRLRPYSGWERFKPVILSSLTKYRDVAHPRTFKQVVLRYINKVDIPVSGPLIKMKECFEFFPLIPDELPKMHGQFSAKIEIPYEDQRDNLVLALQSIVAEKPDVFSAILDIAYVMMVPEMVPIDSIDSWLEKAHQTVETAFESCLTPQCKTLFEA